MPGSQLRSHPLKNTAFRASATSRKSILYFACQRFTKCCACHEICAWRFTKCCTCHETCAWRFKKCCACHENLHMEVHKVLCLPRYLHMEVHKVLCLPRNLHFKKQVKTLTKMEGENDPSMTRDRLAQVVLQSLPCQLRSNPFY